MTTITLPAQTLTVLDAPVTVRHAVEHADPRGQFTATIAVPTETMMGERELGFDAFYDNLVNRLIENCDAFQMEYRILGASQDGHTLYVQASNDLAVIAEIDPDLLREAGLSEAEVAQFVSRVSRTGS